MRDFDKLLEAAIREKETNPGPITKLEAYIEANKHKRYCVYSFPSYKGSPFYTNYWLIALAAYWWRRENELGVVEIYENTKNGEKRLR